jgi:hypothetical protein
MTRGIEIYLKNNIPEEEVIYKIWDAYKKNGHPQILFRKALLTGLSILYLNNEINLENLDDVNLKLLLPPTPILDALLKENNYNQRNVKKRRNPRKILIENKKTEEKKNIIQMEQNKNIDKDGISFQNNKTEISKPKLGRLM